jgi:drug/metabolite transporter (DMT)-like permease
MQYERTMSLGGHDWMLYVAIVIIGGLFIGNFFIYSKSVDVNGVGVSVAAMRLSLLLPVLISVLGYRETLSVGGWIGVGLVFGALYLLMPKHSKQQLSAGGISTGFLLLFLFLGTGLADSSLKIFEEEWSAGLTELEFMAMVFFSAFIIGLIVMIITGSNIINKKELRLGLLLGLPNLYSSIFLLYALQEMNGAIAFTAVNLLNVAGGTLLGKWRWEDSVTHLQWAGLVLALIAISLLIV